MHDSIRCTKCRMVFRDRAQRSGFPDSTRGVRSLSLLRRELERSQHQTFVRRKRVRAAVRRAEESKVYNPASRDKGVRRTYQAPYQPCPFRRAAELPSDRIKNTPLTESSVATGAPASSHQIKHVRRQSDLNKREFGRSASPIFDELPDGLGNQCRSCMRTHRKSPFWRAATASSPMNRTSSRK